jgi:hypothetical protein
MKNEGDVAICFALLGRVPMIAPRISVLEVDQSYLDLITELRRRTDPNAPAATMEEVGRYSMIAILDGFQDRSNALNCGDRLSEIWAFINYWSLAE